jgi:transcriptional regulator with XRE-family HTH domain
MDLSRFGPGGLLVAFGDKLKELRIRNNKSLQELADAVEASKAHIWDLERGNSKNPSLDLITKIASFFKVSVAEMVGEDPNALNEDPELVAMYRDLKDLDGSDLETIRMLIERFKSRKADT